MNTSIQLKNKFSSILFVLVCFSFYAQVDIAPVITAKGKQAFCPGNSVNVVTDFSITDADDTTIDSFFIQISSGYQVNLDELELIGNHPNIKTIWNNSEGKLSFTSTILGSEMLLTDLENAVKGVIFKTNSLNITLEKTFSLTIDNANYLPSTKHFYEFVAAPRITWTAAKTAAENRTFYGRQGYLATLTSQEEADFAGKQATGAGWIGASDQETEGEWKWVTGPEAGTIFWRGQISGTTTNFANWNRREPNDFRGNNPVGEDYAHITDPSIGITGAWNDLPNEGGTNLYVPKGYIVEYGTLTDPDLNIAASTSIYIPQITSIKEANICESGSATISATANEGTILWYDSLGNFLISGNNFTTPNLTISTTYFATVSINGCLTTDRTAVNVVVNKKPTITNFTEDIICSGSAILTASASEGIVYWYDSLTSTTPLFVGDAYRTSNLNKTTPYYVTANTSSCESDSRTAIRAIVNTTIPEFNLVKNDYFLCDNLGTVTLETKDALDNYRYVWTRDGANLIDETPSIKTDKTGIYTVKAFSLAGCESLEKTITVSESGKATITNNDIIIVDDSTNNSIKVMNTNLGIGNYEYSLDDELGVYKNDGFFENISVGIHTLYVKDKNGCGIEKYTFSILAYPTYFTPNGDRKNDFWTINGFNSSEFTNSEVYIYNRFGMLLYKIDANNDSWDGNYKGKKLPTNSYWYRAILIDKNDRKIEKTGNFSLIRN